MGLREAITIPLIAETDLTRFGLPVDDTVRATNALNAEEPVLRPAILPGLLKSVARNVGYGLTDLGLFELGHVFRTPPAGQLLPDERDHAAVVLTGTVRRAPVEPDRPVDVYDAMDALHAIVDDLQLAGAATRPADHPGYRPGRCASIVVDGAVVGAVGELDPAVLGAFGIAGPAVAFEAELAPILAGARRDQEFVPLSSYPAATMDLAFVLDETVPAADVLDTVRRRLRARGGRPRLRRVPRRVAGCRQAQPRGRRAIPGARPHAQGQGARRGAPGVHRRRRALARRGAARLMHG